MEFLKKLWTVAYFGLSIVAGAYFTYKYVHATWAISHVQHQPLVRRPGYPIVAKNIENTKKYTTLVSLEGFEGGYRGTGILIDSMTVLTCYHMVHSLDDDEWIYVYPGKRVVKAHPDAGDREHDLAVLKLEEPVQLDHYAVFNTTTTVGEPITVVGNMLGAMRWMVTYGVVGGYEGNYILTDALIHGGNSGGPWINDKGEVVAITNWGLDSAGHQELGVSGGMRASVIVEFIDNYQHPEKMWKRLFEALFGKPKPHKKPHHPKGPKK